MSCQGGTVGGERLLVDVGNAEQRADHRDRQWSGELADQVEARVRVHGVEELTDSLCHQGLVLRHSARCEGRGDEAAEPGVLGWVHLEQREVQHLARQRVVGGLLRPEHDEGAAADDLRTHRVCGRDEVS
jgi:hypothetical protein